MLMIKSIVCDHCKKANVDIKYRLTLIKKEEWCKKCSKYNEETTSFQFCSSRCLKLHSKLLNKHEHKWDFGRFGVSAKINGIKVEKVYVHCLICKEQRWMKPTKTLIKKYHKLNPNVQTLMNAVKKRKSK